MKAILKQFVWDYPLTCGASAAIPVTSLLIGPHWLPPQILWVLVCFVIDTYLW